MDDTEIIRRVGELVEREHHLEQAHGDRPLDESELEELREIETHLDQCWDLLRQRRARREFGLNPDEAQLRAEGTVEHYQQ